MIIYEVNLHVDLSIAEEYYKWLLNHIQELLEIDVFQSAKLLEIELEIEEAKTKKAWSVQYFLNTREDLEDYFQKHAARMKGDAFKYFEGKFTASRRILTTIGSEHFSRKR